MTRIVLTIAAALLFASAPARGQGIRSAADLGPQPPMYRPPLITYRPPVPGFWTGAPGIGYPVAPWFGGYYGYYGGLYGGYYPYPYTYLSNSTSFYEPGPLTPPPLTGAGGTGSAATVVVNPEMPAELTVDFPAAPEVSVNGAAAAGEGATRTFRSPPLKAGEAYTFQVKANWSSGGQRYEWERTVTLGAGERSRVTVARGFPVKD